MTATTTTAAEAWRPNQVASFDPSDRLGDALIVQAATKAGSILGDEPQLLVPYLSSDPEAAIVPEGTDIALSDIEAAQIAVSTHKVALVTRISRELAEQPGGASRIADSLRRGITAKADAVFMSNASDPTGLLEVAGVQSAGDLVTDVFAAFDAVAQIEGDGGEATHLLMSPSAWATLSKLPESEGSNRSLLSDPHDAANRSLAGVPVVVHPAVPAGTALMLDRSEIVAAYGELLLARSEDAFFTQDAIGIRATWRIGWGVVRPARLQKLTVGA